MNDNIPQLIEQLDNQFQDGSVQRLWWAQDGASAHQLIAARSSLLEIFQNRLIALHLPTEWPPRSSDLAPCNYFHLGTSQKQSVSMATEKSMIRGTRYRIKQVVLRRVFLNMRQRKFLEMVATLSNATYFNFQPRFPKQI